jgi:hypothetical protein
MLHRIHNSIHEFLTIVALNDPDFGVPKIIQSDNGKEFVNQIMDAIRRVYVRHRKHSGAFPCHQEISPSSLCPAMVHAEPVVSGNVSVVISVEILCIIPAVQ